MRMFAFSASVLAVTMVGCSASSEEATRNTVPPDAKIETIRGDAPSANMHVAAGDLALSQGSKDEAVRQYQRAVLINPKQADAIFKLATLYVYDRNFDAAIQQWQKYIVATDQSAESYSNLGRTYELAGDWKNAEVNYLKAIQVDPKNRSARVNYGIQLAKRDRIDEAEVQLNTVLTPAQVQYNLGSVFELRKNYVAAKVAYGKAIDLDENLIEARQRLENLKAVSSAND